MKKVNIIIALDNKQYAAALARALQIEGVRANITVGSADRIHNEADWDADNCIVITEEKTKQSLITEKNWDAIKCESNDRSNQDKNILVINEFETPKHIIQFLREYTGQYQNESIQNAAGHECKMIVVTGISGGAGVTSVSEALAEELTVYHGAKVCVLSFSSFPETMGTAAVKDVRKLLYILHNREMQNPNLSKNINTVSDYTGNAPAASLSFLIKSMNPEEYFATDERGVYHPNYGPGVNSVGTASEEDREKLLEYTASECDFDYLICDIPSEKVVCSAGICDMAFRILMVEKPCDSGNSKNNFKKFIYEKLAGSEEKVIEVINFAEYDDFEEENGSDNGKIYAENDENSVIDGLMRIDGSFGLAIKNIAHRLAFC